MFLHLGGDTVVSIQDVICIMDYNSSNISKETKAFLKLAEQEKRTIKISSEETKSFIITQRFSRERKGKKSNSNKIDIYYSPISSITLVKRMGFVDKISLDK